MKKVWFAGTIRSAKIEDDEVRAQQERRYEHLMQIAVAHVQSPCNGCNYRGPCAKIANTLAEMKAIRDAV